MVDELNKLSPYCRYKGSGVPWLGDVPEHWGVARLKGHLNRNDSGVWSKDAASDGTVVLRSTEQTVDGGWRLTRPARIRLTLAQQEAATLALGDLVVTKSSGSASHIGKTSLVTAEIAALGCCFSNFMQRLRPADGVESRFLWYVLNCPIGREQLVFHSTTTTGLGNLNGTIIGECRLGLPPLPEQAAIVRFLDHADRRIRRYIRAKQKLIKLLEEQRQAIIHQAVTRGLDPNVRLKPSGVEWLGDVPEHWEVTRLSRIVRSSNAGEVIDKGWWGRGEEVLYTCARLPLRSDYSAFPTGKRTTGRDLLLTRNGTPYVHRPVPRAIYSNVVQRVHLRGEDNREWIARTLEASTRGMKGYGVSIESLNYDMWKVLVVLIPPREEQDAIIAEVDERTGGLARLIDSTTRQIDFLREYRTRLIADVVTGKLDVRQAAARLPNEVEEPEPFDEIETAGDTDEASTDDADEMPEEAEA